MADAMTDNQKFLDDIRREVIEARNMTIKTDNALKSLHAELKVVSQSQDQFQKRTWFSTGMAYLVFAALAVGAAVLVSGARASNATAERERLEKQTGDLNGTIDKLRADASAATASEQSALQVYKMMTSLPGDERLKGIDALQKLDTSKLSAFTKAALQDRATILRKEVGEIILEKGKSAFRRQEWPESITQLNRFLSMNPAADEALDAEFFLGNAYFQMKKFDEALKHLTKFADGDKKARTRDFALVMIMQSYDMLGNREQAAATARDAYQTYPNSDFRNQFIGRLQRNTKPKTGEGTPAVSPATPAHGPQ
jgi:TolA-binding protein